MRIALETSITTFNNAGSARYALELLQAFQTTEIELLEVKVTRKFRFPAPGIARKVLVAYWEYIYSTYSLPLWLKKNPVDLLHCTIPMPLQHLNRERNYKIVVTLHDLLPFSHPQWFPTIMGIRLRKWLKASVQVADHLIASSEYTKKEILNYLKLSETNVTVVYLGKKTPSNLAKDSQTEMPFLLTVGTLEPRKNLVAVLEAYKLVKQRIAFVPKLLIVGGKGWSETKLQTLITEFGLKDQVELRGFVPDETLFVLYQQAKVFIYPSLAEGFGFPPLEAMACGCPVITSNAASLPEVVGNAGLMVDPKNIQQLAMMIQRVLEDKNLAQELRQQGFGQAERFSWPRCAQETSAVYQQVLKK